MFHYTVPDRLARYKHYNLFCPFVSCKENEVFRIESLNLSVFEERQGGEVVDAVGLCQPLVVDLDKFNVELLSIVIDGFLFSAL